MVTNSLLLLFFQIYPYVEHSYHESLINELAHRDYLINGSEVHIDIYDDRIKNQHSDPINISLQSLCRTLIIMSRWMSLGMSLWNLQIKRSFVLFKRIYTYGAAICSRFVHFAVIFIFFTYDCKILCVCRFKVPDSGRLESGQRF